MKVIHSSGAKEIIIANKLYFFERFHATSGILFEHEGGYIFISKIEMDEFTPLVNAVAIDEDGNKSFSCKFVTNGVLKDKYKTYSEMMFILNTMSANRFQQVLNLQLATGMWTEDIPDHKMNLNMRKHIVEKHEETFVMRHLDEKPLVSEETDWYELLFNNLLSLEEEK